MYNTIILLHFKAIISNYLSNALHRVSGLLWLSINGTNKFVVREKIKEKTKTNIKMKDYTARTRTCRPFANSDASHYTTE